MGLEMLTLLRMLVARGRAPTSGHRFVRGVSILASAAPGRLAGEVRLAAGLHHAGAPLLLCQMASGGFCQCAGAILCTVDRPYRHLDDWHPLSPLPTVTALGGRCRYHFVCYLRCQNTMSHAIFCRLNLMIRKLRMMAKLPHSPT